MKLIGSLASPYVRRIRIQLGDRDYDFEPVNVFSDEGQKRLLEFSPTIRVPILLDEENIIWDSLLIAQYLSGAAIEIETQKHLVLVNEITDAGIQLFQLRKFGTDANDSGIFSQNNLKRIDAILKSFENKNLDNWDLVSQWLFCTLEWFDHREVYDWRPRFPELERFVDIHQGQAFVSETAPK